MSLGWTPIRPHDTLGRLRRDVWRGALGNRLGGRQHAEPTVIATDYGGNTRAIIYGVGLIVKNLHFIEL